MARKYHTLAVFEDGQWAPQFGDWDKDVVKQEREDSYDGQRTCIVTTDGSQAAIDATIAEMNAAL